MPPIATTNRRTFVHRVFRAGALAVFGGGGAYGYGNQIERHYPVVERIKVSLPGLGSAWNGFRVVQISDLHLEPIVDQELLRTTVAAINALKPDLIVLTGDYITSNAMRIANLAEPLSELKARAGVFGCMGNHDMGWRGKVYQGLKAHGVECLINSGHDLALGNDHLWVAGLDSAWGGHPVFEASMAAKRKDAATLLLMHEPDYADVIAQSHTPLLQLSGHTHGGQCCLPGGLPVHLPKWGRKYAKGLFQVGKMQLYVNRGIGCIGLPLRFACSPEITEITLGCA